MRLTSGLPHLCLGLVSTALLLTACGGGSGDSGSGGGNSSSLLANPTQLTVTATGDYSWSPTGTINVSVRSVSTGGIYIGASFTKTAITAMTFTSSGSQGIYTLTFKDPSTVAPGSYSDTIKISICTDSSCTNIQSGSTITVPVTYVVTVDSTVTLSANPTIVGAGQPTTLTWASTHAQSCTASGEWSGSLSGSGSQTVTPTTQGIHTYSISCGNPGTPAQASLTVTAEAPAVTFSSFPPTAPIGKPVTLRWQGQYATGCVASGDWSGSLPASGFRTLTLTSAGTTNYHLVCSNSGSSDQKDASITMVTATTSTPATSYRITASHDGVLTTTNATQYPSQSAPSWTRDLGAPVSYPLIVNDRVYLVTAELNQSYGSLLYALDANTGATVWGPISIAGTYFGSGLTYENGRLFVLMFEGDLHAFNAVDGAALWTVHLPTYWFEATPNAFGGIVFAAGDGGVSAVDETSGNILWTSATGTTDWASPAVSSEGVFIQEGYGCNANAYDPVLGTPIWHNGNAPCNMPWGYASIIKNGIFFGRVGGALDLFDSATGNFRVQIASDRAPAVTDSAIIGVSAGALTSTRLSDFVQSWSFRGNGSFITAPVVVNNTAFAAADDNKVYAVDVGTGAKTWTGTSPVPLSGDSENGGPMPPSGPAAGENLLIFPAGNSLVAWKLQ